jgi:hypothetical protein
MAVAARPEAGAASPMAIAARLDDTGVARTDGVAARGEACRVAAASPSMERGRPSSPSGGGGASIGIKGENGGVGVGGRCKVLYG